MRLFYLENEVGDRMPLNNETGIFLSEPEGLGLDFGDTFASSGNGFFVLASSKYNQKVIGGKLNFMEDPYNKYHEFIGWLYRSQKLYFVYNPFGTEYYLDVRIGSLEKTEINKLGYMEIPAKFVCLSPWYIKDHSDGEISYASEDDTDEEVMLRIQPKGHIPASIKLLFHYPIFIGNDFVLIGADTGNEYGRLSLSYASRDENNILDYSSDYRDSHVYEINVLKEKTDLIQYVNLSYNPFFRVPTNEECLFIIKKPKGLPGYVVSFDITVLHYYLSI